MATRHTGPSVRRKTASKETEPLAPWAPRHQYACDKPDLAHVIHAEPGKPYEGRWPLGRC